MSLNSICPPISGLTWLKGGPVHIPSASHVLVIEFWASWCGPCRAMPPHLSKLQQKYKKDGLVVIGISTDEDQSAAVRFVQQSGEQMDYTVAVDTAKQAYTSLMTANNIHSIPHAFIIDRDGKIVHSSHPAQPDFEQTVSRACSKPLWKEVALPLITATEEELMARPAKELKAILIDRGIPVNDCFEKHDFASKINKMCRSVQYYSNK